MAVNEDWEPDEFTSATCRPVTLESGGTVPVLGAEPLSPQGVAALAEVIDAALAKAAAENPPDDGAAELRARIEAVRGDRSLRECARLVGVRFSVLFRIGQGRMPGAQDLAKIEAWLQGAETCTPTATSQAEPAPGAGGSAPARHDETIKTQEGTT